MHTVWGKRHTKYIEIQKYIYKNIYIYTRERERTERVNNKKKEEQLHKLDKPRKPRRTIYNTTKNDLFFVIFFFLQQQIIIRHY